MDLETIKIGLIFDLLIIRQERQDEALESRDLTIPKRVLTTKDNKGHNSCTARTPALGAHFPQMQVVGVPGSAGEV